MEKREKFTPGPWSIEKMPEDTHNLVVNGAAHRVICLSPANDAMAALLIPNSVADWAHNQHLIAAAPELYEVLKYIVEHEKTVMVPDLVHRAFEVLRKAINEQPK